MMSLKNNYEFVSTTLNRAIAQQKYNIDESCSICLSSMLNQTVIHIPCGHIFHNNCLNSVFKSNCLTKYNCPLCRYDIYSALQQLGFPPLHLEGGEDNQDDEHYDNAIIIIASIHNQQNLNHSK